MYRTQTRARGGCEVLRPVSIPENVLPGLLHNRSSKGQVQGFHFAVVLNLHNGFTLYIHSIETYVEESPGERQKVSNGIP